MLRLHRGAALWRQISSRAGLESGGGPLASRFASKAGKPVDENDASAFELLPPGCSMVDPTYAIRE